MRSIRPTGIDGKCRLVRAACVAARSAICYKRCSQRPIARGGRPMSPEPDVVLAEPDPPQSASQFWDDHCRPLGADRLQFVGLDAEAWLQQKSLCEITTWVKDLRTILASQL